jgi:two-component system chemotaxis response regulator CheB
VSAGVRTKVLIVDDEVVVRRMLTDIIGADPELDVAGAASNGKLALARIPQLNPDVVILDIEMPEMDGLTTLAELRKTWKTLPVIMFSTLTEPAAAATLDALALGANDYVAKPANVGSATLAMQRIRDELIPKIKQFGDPGGMAGWRRPSSLRPASPGPGPRTGNLGSLTLDRGATKAAAPLARPPAPLAAAGGVDAIGIVSSTGGPNALAELVPALPADLGVPVLIVQHMPPLFTSLLAKRLDGQSKLRVHEGAAKEQVRAGDVWIAPGGFHMVARREDGGVRLGTNTGPPENSCRPAGDVLLRSMVEVWGGRVLAVALTGMGGDGTRGCELLKARGGQVLAQDEATSVVWGIPGGVVRAGLADQVLPIGQLAAEITRRAGARGPVGAGRLEDR